MFWRRRKTGEHFSVSRMIVVPSWNEDLLHTGHRRTIWNSNNRWRRMCFGLLGSSLVSDQCSKVRSAEFWFTDGYIIIILKYKYCSKVVPAEFWLTYGSIITSCPIHLQLLLPFSTLHLLSNLSLARQWHFLFYSNVLHLSLKHSYIC